MYTFKNVSTRNVRCNATTRRQKHSNIRKNVNEKRKTQNEKLRSSLGAIAKDETERITTIWEAHKEFFANDAKSSDEDKTIEPIVVDDDDLESANGFFEES